VDGVMKKLPIIFKRCPCVKDAALRLSHLFTRSRDEVIIARLRHILIQSDDNVARSKAVKNTLREVITILERGVKDND